MVRKAWKIEKNFFKAKQSHTEVPVQGLYRYTTACITVDSPITVVKLCPIVSNWQKLAILYLSILGLFHQKLQPRQVLRIIHVQNSMEIPHTYNLL